MFLLKKLKKETLNKLYSEFGLKALEKSAQKSLGLNSNYPFFEKIFSTRQKNNVGKEICDYLSFISGCSSFIYCGNL